MYYVDCRDTSYLHLQTDDSVHNFSCDLPSSLIRLTKIMSALCPVQLSPCLPRCASKLLMNLITYTCFGCRPASDAEPINVANSGECSASYPS